MKEKIGCTFKAAFNSSLRENILRLHDFLVDSGSSPTLLSDMCFVKICEKIQLTERHSEHS